jgi:hypothetical protein
VNLGLYALSCLVLFALLVLWSFCRYSVGKYQDLIEVVRESPRFEKENIGLREGQTIVGVRETTKTLCFYIGDGVMDEKNYE